MKKIKKLIMILLTIFNLILPVKAGVKDSTLVRTKIDGIYAIAPLSDKTHLYNLEIFKMNGNVSYCIEIGKKITSDTYNSTDILNEQKNITNLSETDLDHIKAVAYFGYGYENHQDIKYYMASQELIWEYLNKIDITWTNELDINGPKINIDIYKNEINDLVNRYLTPLSLKKSASYNIGTTNTMIDPNNSLEFYNVTTKKNTIATISKNTLEIKISPKYIRNDTIILTRKKYYNEQSKIYNFDNSQIMLSAGNLKNLEHDIELYITGATLKVNLIDKDTKAYIPTGQALLKGSTYELYDKDKNILYTYEYDNISFFIYTNLSYEKYYIKQKMPGKGYKQDEKIIEININQLNNNITLEEEVIKSTIEITKLFEQTQDNKREKDITFEIYDINNNLYTTLITTENGPDIVTLPYGKYTIKQKNTTYGYEKVNDIELNIDEDTNTTIKYNLLDKKIKSKINITTKDKDTNEIIKESNITYKIFDKETNEYVTYQDNNTKTTEFKTNDSGEILLPIELPYGTYLIEQTSPPKHYLENKEKIEVIINDKTEYNYKDNNVLINIDYFNEEIKGKLIIKTLNNNNTSRENIKIEIYNEEKIINTYQTDNEGTIIIDNIPLSYYCIIDTSLNKKECINLINTDNKTRIIEKEIIFKNYIKKDKYSKTKVKVPNTLSKKNTNKYIVIPLFLILLINIIIKRIKKRKKHSIN